MRRVRKRGVWERLLSLMRTLLLLSHRMIREVTRPSHLVQRILMMSRGVTSLQMTSFKLLSTRLSSLIAIAVLLLRESR